MRVLNSSGVEQALLAFRGRFIQGILKAVFTWHRRHCQREASALLKGSGEGTWRGEVAAIIQTALALRAILQVPPPRATGNELPITRYERIRYGSIKRANGGCLGTGFNAKLPPLTRRQSVKTAIRHQRSDL